MSKRKIYSRDEPSSPKDVEVNHDAIKRLRADIRVNPTLFREQARLCRALFSGVDDPLWEPTSPGLREQIDNAQHDKDVWKPVSPALAKRIEAAVESWTARRGKDFYREITENAGKSRRLNDEDLWGAVSVAIAKMEDYFASVLEHLPPTGVITVIPEHLLAIDDPTFVPENYIPEDDIEYTVTTAVVYAIQGLAHAASCRRDIGAKRTASAVFEMSIATELYWVTITTLRDDAAIPLIEAGHNSKKRHRRSTTTKGENLHERDLRWAREDRKLSRDHPHYNATGRAREIAERETRRNAEKGERGISYSTVMTRLKKLREEENDPTADS
jgi:hypothetical protein